MLTRVHCTLIKDALTHTHIHTHTHTHMHAHTLTAVGPVSRGRRSEGQEASSTDPLPSREELLSLPQEQGGGREETTRAAQILKVSEDVCRCVVRGREGG